MDSLAIAIAHHGYSILFTLVLMEALGFPIPAALAILTAGAASAHGPMHPVLSPATALAALFIGDTSLYLLGRYTGWWTLRLLCILSLNPDTCILRSADVFFKRGKIVLLFAKFLPGVNTMAAPLAGSMNMKLGQFLRYDLGGALLYAMVYSTIGYVFSDFLGHYLGRTLAILFAAYLAWRAGIAIRQRRSGPVNGVTALEVSRNSGQFAIFDVRSHGYYDKGAKRIRGSVRLEPNAVGNAALDFPKDKKIVLYCT
jgi:membrane protein DedA with SNARE-associated domain